MMPQSPYSSSEPDTEKTTLSTNPSSPLQLEFFPAQRRRQRRENRMPGRVDEVDQVGIERVELVVDGQVDVPPVRNLVFLRNRSIGFLLPVAVVHIHRGDVQPWVGEIVQVRKLA